MKSGYTSLSFQSTGALAILGLSADQFPRQPTQRRQVFYDRVKAERDELAAELADIYPPLHRLPRDGERLLVAELVARGLRGFVESGVQIPRITHTLRMPACECYAVVKHNAAKVFPVQSS